MAFSFFPFNNCILARFSVSSPLLNMAFKMTSPFDVPELKLVGCGEIFFLSYLTWWKMIFWRYEKKIMLQKYGPYTSPLVCLIFSFCSSLPHCLFSFLFSFTLFFLSVFLLQNVYIKCTKLARHKSMLYWQITFQ